MDRKSYQNFQEKSNNNNGVQGWKKNDEDQNYLDSRKIDNGW